MAILASFGEEIRPELEALTKDENPLIRYNALETLYMIALQENASPELSPFLLRELEPIRDSEDVKRASWARRLVKELEEMNAASTL